MKRIKRMSRLARSIAVQVPCAFVVLLGVTALSAGDTAHAQDVTLVTNIGQPYTWYDGHGQKGFDLPGDLTNIEWEAVGIFVGTAGGFILGGTLLGPGGALGGATIGAIIGNTAGDTLTNFLKAINDTYDTHTHPYGIWIDGGIAQQFRTGSNRYGYDISSAAIYGRYFPGQRIEVPLSISVWSNSNGIPGSLLYTLPYAKWVNDGSYGLRLVFQAPVAAILEPKTDYFLVVGYTDESRVVITSSASEDAGALAGWSIGNGLLKKNGDVWGSVVPADAGRRIFPANRTPVLRTALHGTSLDSRSIIVSLTKTGEGQFKATATASAPFDIVLPLNVIGGGGPSSITIPASRTESDVLSVSRTPGTTLPVSVDIGNLPSPPATHADYALFKSPSRLPLQVINRVSGGTTPVCDRTALVRDAIVRAAPVSTCGEVTEAHLAAINTLSASHGGEVRYTELQTGDFSGLTALTGLNLSYAYITTLPDGIFDDLTSLKGLNLYLSPLTSGLDEVLGLTSLTSLNLGVTRLTSLPPGAFDRLTQLTSLDLSLNDLSSLPAGIFDHLPALTSLNLDYNDLTSLPARVFDRLPALTRLDLDGLELTSLPDRVFYWLASLKSLSMSVSRLRSLSSADFSGLSGLTYLNLYGNRLTNLPSGIFSGLSSLTSLNLSRSTIPPLLDPLALTVSLEQVGEGQFKAVAPTGAPFPIVLLLNITNGSINGGASTLTIPTGRVDSGHPQGNPHDRYNRSRHCGYTHVAGPAHRRESVWYQTSSGLYPRQIRRSPAGSHQRDNWRPSFHRFQ